MIAIFPEIAACAASGDLERLGILVRNYFGGDQKFAPSLDMVAIMKTAGIEVQRLPLDSRAALLAKDENGSFQITAVLTEGLSAEEERFTLAHMLGHFLLNVQPLIAKGDWDVSGFRETACPMKRYSQCSSMPELSAEEQEIEALADDFAAAALLPKAMVRRAMEKVQDEEQVAKFFGIPALVLRRRLQQVGLSAEGDPVNFIDAAEKMGQSLETPLADLEKAPQIKAPKVIAKGFAAARYDRAKTSEAGGAKASKSNPSPLKAQHKPQTVVPKPGAEKGTIHKGEGGTKVLSGMDRIRQLARQIDKNV